MAETVAYKYRAFISYSHADTSWAKWLHRGLEGFRIDKDLVGRETATGAIPKSLRPIFRESASDPTLALLAGFDHRVAFDDTATPGGGHRGDDERVALACHINDARRHAAGCPAGPQHVLRHGSGLTILLNGYFRARDLEFGCPPMLLSGALAIQRCEESIPHPWHAGYQGRWT